MGVVTGVLLANGGNLLHLLGGNVPHLGGLRVNQLGSLLKLLVNELLVADVDEGNEEDDGGSDDGKAPVRDKLDQEVGDEGRDEGLDIVRFIVFGSDGAKSLQQWKRKRSQQR